MLRYYGVDKKSFVINKLTMYFCFSNVNPSMH